MNDDLITIEADDRTKRVEREEDVRVGQWYWVGKKTEPATPPKIATKRPRLTPAVLAVDEEDDEDEDDYEDYDEEEVEEKKPWLACIVHVGSNYVKLHGNPTQYGYHTKRVHFDDFFDILTHEPDAKKVIQGKIEEYRLLSQGLMDQVQRLTARLGVQERAQLPSEVQEENAHALMVISGTEQVEEYKTALVKAKEETLPDLFQKINEAHKEMAAWMQAEMLPFKAMANGMTGTVKLIEGRIFNISLYAGLTENVIQVRDGEPALITEKLRLMQRRLYMDEECLLNYRVGGMEFEDLQAFDKWVAEDENFNRMLPFPRCMVAMQVRRTDKDRHQDGTLETAWINFQLKEADKRTFFYIRNGEQLYCMESDLEFGHLIFPNQAEFNPTEPMMMSEGYHGGTKTMSVREFDQLVAEKKAEKKLYDAWCKANSFKKWKAKQIAEGKRKKDWPWLKREYHEANPHSGYDKVNASKWEPFNPDSVYFDDCLQEIKDQTEYYNRIALIIQGLYDRSPVLHPHPPVQTWTPEGFAAAIELIYDHGGALYPNAEAPDFEAYRERCNASLREGSIVVGQDRAWWKREAAKENERRSRRSYEYSTVSDWWYPDGDPGPGEVARVAKWRKRKREAMFSWYKERSWQRRDWDNDAPVRRTLTVPEKALFNIDAYHPGDYRIFFEDPRTRSEYFKWAHLLLTAEEYHAGNVKPQEPDTKPGDE